MKIKMGLIALIFIIILGYTYYHSNTQPNSILTYSDVNSELISYNEISNSDDLTLINKLKNYIKDLKLNKPKEENKKIPILIYHHISEDPKSWNNIVISPKKFREDMLYIKALGYNAIHFKDYIDYRDKNIPLPNNPIIITFDDGYRSNYKYAYPVLKELNMKATISMIGNLVGSNRGWFSYFTWEEAKEMYDSGLIDIGHHSYSLHNPKDEFHDGGVLKRHNEDGEIYEKRFIEDTLKLNKLIKENLGMDVILYTYPYGFYNDTTEKLLKELGFEFTLTVREGLGNLDEGFLLKRINSPNDISSVDLMRKIFRYKRIKVDIPFNDIKDQDERIKKLEGFLEEKESL